MTHTNEEIINALNVIREVCKEYTFGGGCDECPFLKDNGRMEYCMVSDVDDPPREWLLNDDEPRIWRAFR